MRILLITGSFPPMMCGVGDYTACLAEALAKQPETTVAVLTSSDVKGLDRTATGIEIFPLAHTWDIAEALPILKFIRQWRPDIVHMQFPTQGYKSAKLPLVLPSLAFLGSGTVVQTWHEYFTKGNINMGILPNFLLPGGLIAVRPRFKEHMPPFFRWLIGHKQFRFIPNASALPRVTLSDKERTAAHERFTSMDRTLLAYFGFIYPHKGVDLLFEIADPAQHHLVLIGTFDDSEPYHAALRRRIEHSIWRGKVTITGFLPAIDAANILAAADAVVLPFRNGGGMWNTSLHGAALQGTFIVTTSSDRYGYDPEENIYFARLGDVENMRQALNMYSGHRNSEANINKLATWNSIAKAHIELYLSLLK